jgi:hypothetical protein
VPNHPNRTITERDVLLLVLDARRRKFLTFDFERQANIDRMRFIPTLEMHGILNHYLITGTFADEPA